MNILLSFRRAARSRSLLYKGQRACSRNIKPAKGLFCAIMFCSSSVMKLLPCCLNTQCCESNTSDHFVSQMLPKCVDTETRRAARKIKPRFLLDVCFKKSKAARRRIKLPERLWIFFLRALSFFFLSPLGRFLLLQINDGRGRRAQFNLSGAIYRSMCVTTSLC